VKNLRERVKKEKESTENRGKERENTEIAFPRDVGKAI